MSNDVAKAEVQIDLAGTSYTLRPSARSAMAVSKRFDGFQRALLALGRLDLDAYVFVVQAAVGARDRQAADLADKVWETGTVDLVGPLSRYVSLLANGGRETQGDAEQKQAAEQQSG